MNSGRVKEEEVFVGMAVRREGGRRGADAWEWHMIHSQEADGLFASKL